MPLRLPSRSNSRPSNDGEATKDAKGKEKRKTWTWRRKASYTYQLFSQDDPQMLVPAVGGLRLDAPLPENILPVEALLLEPTPEEIKTGDIRMIHMNTPLTESEEQLLRDLDEEFRRQDRQLPRSMQVHSLRILQQMKGNVKKAAEQLLKNYDYRMKYLPLNEADVMPELRKGWLYWHGRDRRCRPCLIVRACNIDKETWANNEMITRIVLFTMEYMLRYGLVPGRVENWCVLLDMKDGGRHGIPSISAITSMVHAMQGIYRYRMAWTKIINAPYWFSGLWSAIKKAIPGDSAKKVEILGRDFSKVLGGLFAPNQLEERYGGTAANLEGPQTYAYHFAPGPFSPDAAQATLSRDADRQASPRGGRPEIRAILHEFVPMALHEGGLWVRGREDVWLPRAQQASLTRHATEHLKANMGIAIEPVESYEGLLEFLQSTREDTTDGTPSAAQSREPPAAPASAGKPPAGAPRIQAPAPEETRRPPANATSTEPGRPAASAGVAGNSLRSAAAALPVDTGAGLDAKPKAAAAGQKLPPAPHPANGKGIMVEVHNPATGGTERVLVDGDEVVKAGSRSRDKERNRELGDNPATEAYCPLWCGCAPARRPPPCGCER